MGKKAKFSVIFSLFMLSACATVQPYEPGNVDINVRKNYPSLPPVIVPPMPPLKPFSFDIPRDTSKLVVKNTEQCKKVPENQRDESFWDKCGINPPVPNSNIFLGLDEENFNNLIYDFNILRERILLLEKLINEINKQREEWIKLNRNKNKENDNP